MGELDELNRAEFNGTDWNGYHGGFLFFCLFYLKPSFRFLSYTAVAVLGYAPSFFLDAFP